MRADRTSIRGYFVGLAVLVLGAVGFRVLVAEANIFLMKERVELRRPFDLIPVKLGRWERIEEGVPLDESSILELGTRSYLNRTYAIDGDASRGFVQLHLAYYTGTIDAVPHIPERCWAVAGLELTRNSEGVLVAVDRSKWEPLVREGVDPGKYMMVPVTDPVTADIERVAMPVGDIVMTTIEFQPPKAPELRSVGGYFFIANGRAVANSYGVRQAAFNLKDRYAYYCKIQLSKSGKVSDPNGSLIGPFKADAADFLSELIPQLMRCLPDWPAYEAGGGTEDGSQAAPASTEAGT